MYKSLKTYHLLFFRLILILSGTGISIFLFQRGLIFSTIFGLLITFLFILEMYFYIKNAFLVYDRTITSILQNDFTSDFSKHKSYRNYSSLFKLYENLKNKHDEQVSKDIV